MSAGSEAQALSEYVVFVVRGYTKEKLAQRIQQRLAYYDRENIISINIFSDPWITFFWRRNSALITLCPPQ